MKRRVFVRNLSVLSTGLIILPGTVIANSRKGARSNALKGFIVSDAHFGWYNEVQPSVEKQLLMMQKIRQRFPDLDVFIDTGDAHHNGEEMDQHRGDWTDYMANQTNPVPFYYVPGNHEIVHAHEEDVEFRCNRLGSLSFRPYYSWDLKGIHFISMPELIRAVYIPRELIEWVKLDLEINKKKTTILLSHNNLIGTTDPFVPGYRGVVNSEEILQLMDQYPNVVAWMHGHNHNYEIVERKNRLFVSNGRIGGFDPSRGEYGLGGIYFEVLSNSINVKCYSAEFDKFLDEFAGNEFSRNVRVKTSFDNSAAPEYSYGKGLAKDGEKMPVFNHHANNRGTSELFLSGVSGQVFNEDPEFKYHMIRDNPRGGHWQLMESSINKDFYEFLNPGIKIKKSQEKRPVSLLIPRASHNKFTYYRVGTGREFKIDMEMDTSSGGQEVKAAILVYDTLGNLVREYPSETWKLKAGKNVKTIYSNIIEPGISIYGNRKSDELLNISVSIDFTNLVDDVNVRKVAFSFKEGSHKTLNPAIVYQDIVYKADGEFDSKKFKKLDIPNPAGIREVIEMKAEGNGLFNWIIRHKGWDWQVRNAAIKDSGRTLRINGLRNEWSHKKEVVFVPAIHTNIPYLHKSRNILDFEVGLMNRGPRKLTVEVHKTYGEEGELEFISSTTPSLVEGCIRWEMKENRIICKVEKGSVVNIEFPVPFNNNM